MGKSRGLVAAANKLKAAGRNGDTEIAHLSPNEIAILDYWQGGPSINPQTGEREYFKLKSVLKSVAKAAGALAGAYFGGPAGAAVGGGLTSALLGDSTSKALTTGLLSGLGAYGAQQTGLGDTLGIKGLASGTNLLGQTAAAGAASKGGGMGVSALLPLLGLGAAAAASGGPKAPKSTSSGAAEDKSKAVEYEPLDREQLASGADPYSYGQFGPEFQYFDEVNPALQPLTMRAGGRVYMRFGGESAGDTSEGKGDPTGSKRGGGGGSSGGGSDRSGNASNSVQANSGSRGTLSQQQDRVNAANAARAGNSAPGVSGGPKSSGQSISSAAADKMVMDRYMSKPAERISSEKDYWDAVGKLGSRYNDYQNTGQGLSEDPLGAIGRALGGLFGLGEINPLSQALGRNLQTDTADWGVDPIGAALGLGGFAGVVPFGVPSIYSGIKSITGYPGPVIAFDSQAQPISQDESASNWGWQDSGMLAGLGGLGSMGSTGTASGLGGLRPEPGAGSDRMTARAQAGTPNAVQTSNGTSTTSTGGGAGTTPTPADTSEITDRTYNPLDYAYNYGQFGPEHLFYVNGPLFPPGTTSAAVRPDRMHTIEQPIDKTIPLTRGDLNMRGGGGVSGPGTGQSDDIPAMLSDGEFVVDAATVAALGGGSTDAGVRKLEAMRRNVRKHSRSAKPNKIPPAPKGIGQYMKGAA